MDRWGRSLHDLVLTLKELADLEVGFVSLTETIDLNTALGRAMAGVLAVFAEFEREMLRERVKAGIAQARKKGRNHGRPRTAMRHEAKIRRLFSEGRNWQNIGDQNLGRLNGSQEPCTTQELFSELRAVRLLFWFVTYGSVIE